MNKKEKQEYELTIYYYRFYLYLSLLGFIIVSIAFIIKFR